MGLAVQSKINWSLELATAPAEEPVTTAEAKDHLRVSSAADDSYIAGLVTMARQTVEDYIGRQLITATYDLFLDAWPRIIRPPKPPLQTVTSIEYTDTDGNTGQVWSSSLYQVDAKTHPARIMPVQGETYPSVQAQTLNPIKVRYVAGYGLQANVPQKLKQGLLLLVALLYEERAPIGCGPMNEVPGSVALLIKGHKVNWWI